MSGYAKRLADTPKPGWSLLIDQGVVLIFCPHGCDWYGEVDQQRWDQLTPAEQRTLAQRAHDQHTDADQIYDQMKPAGP